MPITLSHPRRARRSRGGPPQHRAFTIVEMLVVVAIIIVLLTILIVALSQASRAAQRANTTFLMSSVTKGVAAFKGDFGFVPPVLGARNPDGSLVVGAERTAVNPPDPSLADYATRLQE